MPGIISVDIVSADDRISKVETVTKTSITPVCTIFVSQHKKSWRFCHDSSVLQVVPFWSDGETTTQKIIVECPTLAEAIAKIEALELKVSKEQEERISELVAVPMVAVPLPEVIVR